MQFGFGVKISAVSIAVAFALTQGLPYGYSANKQLVAAAKASAVPTRQAPTNAQPAAGNLARPTLTPQQAASASTTIDFLSQRASLSNPAAAQASSQASVRQAQQITNRLATVAANQTRLPQATAAQIASNAAASLNNTNTGQREATIQQIRTDVQNAIQPNRSSSDIQNIQYGQNPQALGTLALPNPAQNKPVMPGQAADSGPAPVIILIHGGGGVEGSRGDLAGPGQNLRSNGYAVFSIDYTLGNMDAAINDALQAIQWVETNAAANNLDANNIGVVGASYGAMIATVLATEHPDQIDCAVAFSPAVDTTPGNYNPQFRDIGGTYTGTMPLHNVSPSTAPTLVFTGTQDLPGFQAPAEAFGSALQANGVGQTLTVQNGSHGTSLMTSQTAAPTIAFLDSNLKRKDKTLSHSRRK